MLIVISPAKTLDFDTQACTDNYSQAVFLDDAQQLMQLLRKLSRTELSQLMKISAKLADLNYDRNINWQLPFSPKNAKQAVLAFKGDVYTGLAAENYTAEDFQFAQKHLRILSGLYGLLKPLDLIQAYRLEMGTKLPNPNGKNLYAFWNDKVTTAINATLEQENANVLINLASNEYFKVIKPKLLNARVITPVFKDFKNGQYKVISFLAKKARGYMTSYIIKNKIAKAIDIKAFNEYGYAYNEHMSTDGQWVFTKEH